MEKDDKYLIYHGLLCPKETHSPESLKYFEEFNVRDDDVIAITYPKSGKTSQQLEEYTVLYILIHATVSYIF